MNENRAVYKMMWKNAVEVDRPQMIIYYGACLLHAGKIEVRIETHTQNMYEGWNFNSGNYLFTTDTK